ncbi:MAG TPA: hypothetical protein VMY88_08860 [Acidimicrobiales bacterium]|nr:hypothetical protein [Acidimicrobiales bacterium]
MPVVAEFEVRHTRAVVPTRRVALGESELPVDPAPGHGGLLLAGVVGAVVPHLSDDARFDLDRLIWDLELGHRVPQPRLRYRFQTDVVGLDRSRHRLLKAGRSLGLEIDDHGALLPQALAAVYATAGLSGEARSVVFRLVRRASRWEGAADDGLLTFLRSGESMPSRRSRHHDERWAMELFGFDDGAEPDRSDVIGRFRELVREAHPDHGGETVDAGDRITDLAAAKRILLAG